MTEHKDEAMTVERKLFEEWYTTHAFNYSRDPIGSRDCSLQWEAWKAARDAQAEVTDEMIQRAMRADFCGHNVADALLCGTDWDTEVMRAALEAALAKENGNG